MAADSTTARRLGTDAFELVGIIGAVTTSKEIAVLVACQRHPPTRAALVAAEIFGVTGADELRGEPVAEVDLADVHALARRIRAIGIELAIVTR
jgi:hypothetical protein